MKIVLTNVPPDKADEIARTLVEERFAACINIYPIKSVYRWKGAIEVDDEQTLLIKVAADRVDALRTRLDELHPYDVMEFVTLAVDVSTSLPAYVDFVRDGCTPQE